MLNALLDPLALLLLPGIAFIGLLGLSLSVGDRALAAVGSPVRLRAALPDLQSLSRPESWLPADPVLK